MADLGDLQRLARGETIEHAVFFCRIDDVDMLSTLEFYSNDIELLRSCAKRVTICTTLSELRAADPGLLWSWWPASSLPAVALWRLRRLPSIVTGAADLSNPLESPRRHRVRRFATMLTARLATLNFAVSEYERADFDRLAPKAAVRTLYHAVDCEYFEPATPSESPTICTIAQINPVSIHRKGIDRVIDVFRLVHDQRPEVRLRIIGPIADEGQRWIDTKAAAGELEGVEFLGHVDRDVKRSVVASSWAYLQPSRYEGFGLAVAEAIACGVTPVVTVAGALPEVVADVGRVAGDETETIARAVLAVIADRPTPERQRDVAKSAERFAVSTREDRARSIIEDWLRDVSAGKRRPRRS